MGDWAQTCLVSHLPIQEGDPVVGFLLVSAGRLASDSPLAFETPADLYQPLTPSFCGVYDGYGTVSLTEAVAANHALGQLRAPKLATVLRHIAADHQQIIAGRQVHLCLMHAGLFERMRSKVTGGPRDVDFELERASSLPMLEFWQSISAKRLPKELAGQPGTTFMFNRMLDSEWEGSRTKRGQPVPRVWEMFRINSAMGFAQDGVDANQQVLCCLWEDGDQDGAVAHLDHCLGDVMVAENMMALRRLWAPGVGLGTQHTSAEIHEWVARWTAGKASSLELLDDLSPSPTA